MRVWLVLGVAVCLTACGGDAGTDAGGRDGGSTDASGMAVDVTIEVRDGRDDTPIAGATLAWDAPGGERVEEVTDAMGRVTVSADWTLGTAAMTVDAPGHVLSSQVELTAEILAGIEEGGVVPFPVSRVRPETVTLSGTFLNTMDDAHRFSVSTNVPGATTYSAVGPDFEIEIPVGEALRLSGRELTGARTSRTELTQTFYGAAVIEIPAATADVSGVEIDLSMAQTFVSVDGSVSSPGTGTPLADASFFGSVSTVESDLNEFLGGMVSSAPNMATPTNIDFTISYYEHPTDTPVTRYFLSDAPNASVVTVPGYPTAGPQDISFPPPPSIITPAFGVMHPLHDPIVIGRIEPGLATLLNVQDFNQDDLVLWLIRNPSGSDTITIPQPPSTIVRSDLFPSTGDVFVRPYVCQSSADREYCERLAVGGRAFDIVP